MWRGMTASVLLAQLWRTLMRQGCENRFTAWRSRRRTSALGREQSFVARVHLTSSVRLSADKYKRGDYSLGFSAEARMGWNIGSASSTAFSNSLWRK